MNTMPLLRRRLAATLVVALAVSGGSASALMSGCGSDHEPTPTERPLTSDEAAMLANSLFVNHDNGGADFQLAAQVAPGATIALQGEIDWSTHRGHATVSTAGVESGVREVFWDDDAVLESRDDLDALLAQAGMPAATWIARDPDPVGRQLDQVLALVTALASEQRDNPLLIEQTPGSAYLRADTLRGVDVVVVRYGTSATSWLAADDGRMLRFESDNSSRTRPVVFDVLSFRPVAIDGPPIDQVIDVAEIRDLYDSVVAAG